MRVVEKIANVVLKRLLGGAIWEGKGGEFVDHVFWIPGGGLWEGILTSLNEQESRNNEGFEFGMVGMWVMWLSMGRLLCVCWVLSVLGSCTHYYLLRWRRNAVAPYFIFIFFPRSKICCERNDEIRIGRLW